MELGASNAAVDSTVTGNNTSSSETMAGYLAGVVLRRQNGGQEAGQTCGLHTYVCSVEFKMVIAP